MAMLSSTILSLFPKQVKTAKRQHKHETNFL